ncbi:MAG: BatA and WFA domain-containing protein [Clostridia bacterium]|nr:BatA and WFA domain-containing protein [Clostridia bacterium]
MRFLYPLGLLGLIGIPVLIIIYIIKSKYTEQTVPSTYLWNLSERFLKRKRPISKLAGILGLVLQLLAVAAISLAIAHPVIILPGAAHDYCFVLDGSGSMNIDQSGKTRLELGKEEISSVIKKAADGSSYTLVYVGCNTSVVYEQTEDKEQALLQLSQVSPEYAANEVTDAIGVAQEYFDENPSVVIYLVTDKAYDTVENMTLINVSDRRENYAISNIEHVWEEDAATVTVTAEAISYESDATLTVELYLNGETTPSATQTVQASKMQFVPVELSCTAVNFDHMSVRIKETDSLALDNEAIVFDVEKENEYDALLVSDRPLFIKSAIQSTGNAAVTVKTPAEYEEYKAAEKKEGFDLYVFDSYNPAQMPTDGAVWLFNLTSNLTGAGFSVQDDRVDIERDGGGELTLVADGSAASTALTKDVFGQGISIVRYVKYGLYRNFTTLFEYENNPIVFAGTNEYGNREVVFAFDLHDSNLPLLFDNLVLFGNLLEYSFPTIVEEVFYYSGDDAEINVISGCKSIRIDSPTGKISYLDTSSATSTFTLEEVGVYTVTLMVGEMQMQRRIYAALPQAERAPTQTAESISLQGEAGTDKRDGKYDDLIALFIGLAVLFLADWVVYCYDRYQLR